MLLHNNEKMFLCSEHTVFRALVYFLSRISELTAQRHRSAVIVRPFVSPHPTLLSSSATCRLPLGPLASHQPCPAWRAPECSAHRCSLWQTDSFSSDKGPVGGCYHHSHFTLEETEPERG